jgi:hypothetical protein
LRYKAGNVEVHSKNTRHLTSPQKKVQNSVTGYRGSLTGSGLPYPLFMPRFGAARSAQYD